MKKGMMSRDQSLPKTTESNVKNGREKAQKAQEQKSLYATFALFRGHPFNVNAHGQFGFKAGQTGSNRLLLVKPPEKQCKCFTMNNLHIEPRQTRSSSVKVSQTSSKQPKDGKNPLLQRFLKIASFRQNVPNRFAQ